MFTIPADTKLSVKLILEAIEFNEKGRERYTKLDNYYLGEHDILKRNKALYKKIQNVVINHAKYITDTNTGYLLGNPVEYQATEDYDLTPVLDQYKQQTIADLDHRIAKELSVKGTEYEMVYNMENKVCSKEIDPRNAICIYDDTVKHNKMYGIVYQKGKEKGEFSYIYVWNDIQEFEYQGVKVQSEWTIKLVQVNSHYFLKVPLIEYCNNGERQGDFEQVISLIDAYNIVQSDRVKDKQQLVDAILAFYGAELTDDQINLLREERVLTGLPENSKVEYIVKAINEADTDVLRQVLEQDIHKISMTPNMSDVNFAGNSSGVAIRYKLLGLEQNTSNKERYFEKGLLERFELYNNYLINLKQSVEIPTYEIDVVFKRNLPQNDLETSQMITNLAGQVSKETLISQLSFIKDAKEEIAQADEEVAQKANIESQQFGTGMPNTQGMNALAGQMGTGQSQMMYGQMAGKE